MSRSTSWLERRGIVGPGGGGEGGLQSYNPIKGWMVANLSGSAFKPRHPAAQGGDLGCAGFQIIARILAGALDQFILAVNVEDALRLVHLRNEVVSRFFVRPHGQSPPHSSRKSSGSLPIEPGGQRGA